ncbi:MAG: DUF885 domain-containing protein [Candidatus Kapaibacterium sp.]
MREQKFVRLVLPFTLCFFLFAVEKGSAQSDFRSQYQALQENHERLNDSTRLHKLFELDWEFGMATYPEWATWEGRYERNGDWTDNSLEAIEKREKESEWSYNVLKSIDRTKLSREERLNYDLYLQSAERRIEGRKFPGDLMPINQLGGIHQDVPQLFEVMPKRTAKDYQDILSRMRGLPTVIDNTIVLMKKGVGIGVTPPKVTLRDIPGQIKSLLKDDPTESPIYNAFREMPESMPESEAKKLQALAVQLYKDKVAPAFWKLHDFMVNEYIPNARESVGMGMMPGGSDWYAHRVKGYTTTDQTPREIFDIGKREVARIRGEMERLIEETANRDTTHRVPKEFNAFNEFLRTDPQFYYTTPEALLTGYRDICKRADPELAKLFGKLPRMPYGVIPIPDYMAKSQTTAYYNGGSIEAGRPGYFYANTYALNSRPKWEMEALALHEAVPGHHLQISIAQELDNLPRWRRDGGYTAYVEGWGLYSESLGEEMGFYKDPYGKYGQLSYEMWRAIRLVVDVGIHEFGWTRQQAIDYFASNSGKPLHDIEVEIDRYIVWPGQALAYKIGELKIKELRAYAEEELGEKFDIRAFHDELLGDGALPMDVLEAKVKEWVEGIRNSK